MSRRECPGCTSKRLEYFLGVDEIALLPVDSDSAVGALLPNLELADHK